MKRDCSVYKRTNQNWIKHVDFIILDVVCLVLSLFLAYALYFRSFDLFSNDRYRPLLILLTLLDFLVSVSFNIMHGVLRRSYYNEFVQTLKQVLLVLAAEEEHVS